MKRSVGLRWLSRLASAPAAWVRRPGAPKATAKKAQFNVDCAEGNEVIGADRADLHGTLTATGTGHRIEFGAESVFRGSIEVRGSRNRVTVGRGCSIRARIVVKGTGQTVRIGDGSTSLSMYLLCAEGCDISIGRWCMFSRDIEIRTTDAHSVIDLNTAKRLNKPRSVSIGDHVWIGVGAFLSKGSRIAEDCIVGAHSFVNQAFTESNVMIAGSPAQVVRRGVTWQRSSKPKFSRQQLDAWRHAAPSAASGTAEDIEDVEVDLPVAPPLDRTVKQRPATGSEQTSISSSHEG